MCDIYQSLKPGGKLHAEATHIKVFVDALQNCLQTLVQIAWSLLSGLQGARLFLLAAQPRNRSFVEQDNAAMPWLRARAFLRIRVRPWPEAAFTACKVVVARDGAPIAAEKARTAVREYDAWQLRNRSEHLLQQCWQVVHQEPGAFRSLAGESASLLENFGTEDAARDGNEEEHARIAEAALLLCC